MEKAIPIATITRITYSLPIPLNDFISIEEKDSVVSHGYELFRLLEKKSRALNVDYNGHFGPQIIFTLRSEDDTPEEHERICQIIQEYIDDFVV